MDDRLFIESIAILNNVSFDSYMIHESDFYTESENVKEFKFSRLFEVDNPIILPTRNNN